MEKDKIQEFTMRVTQASKTELVVILYDVILSDLREASKQLDQGNKEGYNKELQHTLKCINELMATLDYTIELSRDLLSLYSFINKEVISAMMKKDAQGLGTVASVITKLKDAFEEVSKQDKSGPVMENTQQVYAGLTYGKGTLNESYLGSYEQNRGFKV